MTKPINWLALLVSFGLAGPAGAAVIGTSGGAASGSSSLGATNLLTTNCVVTAEGDTNRIVITLAGYGAVNGT